MAFCDAKHEELCPPVWCIAFIMPPPPNPVKFKTPGVGAHGWVVPAMEGLFNLGAGCQKWKPLIP